MTSVIEERSRKGQFSRHDKTMIEQTAKSRIEKDGGKFIWINWKKRTVHYVSKTGKKLVVRGI